MKLARLLSNSAALPLALPVAAYITRQRDRLGPLGCPVPEQMKWRLRHYFPATDLDRARIVERDPLPIPDPPLSRLVRTLGFDFLAPSEIAGITFDHVIASRAAMSTRMLFHELVHVVQFRLLGTSEFSRLYVRGFLESRSYYGIPLERCAFDLEQDFDNGRPAFDVQSEVAAWSARGLF